MSAHSVFIVDAHLDLAMNAIEWNRDLKKSVMEIRDRENGLNDKLDRAKGTVALIASIFNKAGLIVNVWIDINTGINRTGVDAAAANDLLDKLFDPLLTYFTKQTGRSLSIVAGGSPTFRTHINRDVECSPGTFVFWDMGYKRLFPDEPFQPAALVITRVVSIVNSTTITTDLGYKSVAAENPLPRVYFLNAPLAIPVYQNEEHLIMEVPNSEKYKPGDVLYGMPEHICPTVALYEGAVIIDDNRVRDHWKIVGRNRVINF